MIWNGWREALSATFPDGSPDYRARVMARTALLAEAYENAVHPTDEQGSGPIIVGRPPRGLESLAVPENVHPLPAAGDAA